MGSGLLFLMQGLRLFVEYNLGCTDCFWPRDPDCPVNYIHVGNAKSTKICLPNNESTMIHSIVSTQHRKGNVKDGKSISCFPAELPRPRSGADSTTSSQRLECPKIYMRIKLPIRQLCLDSDLLISYGELKISSIKPESFYIEIGCLSCPVGDS